LKNIAETVSPKSGVKITISGDHNIDLQAGWQEWAHFQPLDQGCQMVCFQTKNPNLGKFWRVLDWKMCIYFMAIWNILWRFGTFCIHLVHFVFIWYIFPVLVSCTNKNPATLHWTIVFFGKFFLLLNEPYFLGYLFPRKKLCIYFDQKMRWTTIWAIFFTNSSGHPACKLTGINETSMRDCSAQKYEMDYVTRCDCTEQKWKCQKLSASLNTQAPMYLHTAPRQIDEKSICEIFNCRKISP
jgi:hypothetical protein